MIHSIILVLLVLFTMLNGGCQDIANGRISDPKVVAVLLELKFPKDAQTGADPDVIVVRDGPEIRIVNRTPQAFHDQYLWLNRSYVAKVDQIKIGTDNGLKLTQFINLHGEPFPVGTFLAPDKARPLISADLFDPSTSTLYRLVVRSEE